MSDPLDTHGDKLRQALHAADARPVFVCDPYALDNIRVRIHRRRWYRPLTVAALLTAYTVLLLLALRGS